MAVMQVVNDQADGNQGGFSPYEVSRSLNNSWSVWFLTLPLLSIKQIFGELAGIVSSISTNTYRQYLV